MAAENFASWIKEKGGNDEFIAILASFGFTSKLALANLLLDSDNADCKGLLAQMNCGQKCLLQGLISASKDQKQNAYKEGLQKTTRAITKGKDFRSTLGQLFNKQMSHQEVDEGLVPGPSHTASASLPQKRKIKGKGKYPAKGPIKRKVKEYRLRVVGLKKMCSKTPVGAVKEAMTKNVWIHESAVAEEVARKIREAFNWSDTTIVQYMYANGRYLRHADVKDVENTESWDSDAVRALMGSGCLYVVKGIQNTESTSVLVETNEKGNTDEDDNDDDDDIHHPFPSCKSTLQANLKTLREVFHTLPEDEIEKKLLQYGFDEAVEHLLAYQGKIHEQADAQQDLQLQHNLPENSNLEFTNPEMSSYTGSTASNPIIIDHSISETPKESLSLKSLLSMHQSKVLDPTTEYVLSVDRSSPEKLWQCAVCFYKSVMVKPTKLYKELLIQFDGECGVDSGALRCEFFEDALCQANLHLFEGENDRRIVKKDWGLEILCEMFGILMAHSIMQGGPSFKCLSPCVYQYLCTESIDECFPVKDDIPLNIATHDMVTFIEELNDASTEEEIDRLLDKPSNACILNSSAWCITELITPINKLQFLQHLIHDEVIVKRERNLKAISRGINYLELGKLLKMYPDILRSLFVAEKNPEITATAFLSMITCDEPKDDSHIRALEYFKQFVVSIEKKEVPHVNLPSLLRYITGSSSVPPLRLSDSNVLKISFQLNDENVFPKAQACFQRLLLPIVHDSQESFNAAFTKALEFGCGFGNF